MASGIFHRKRRKLKSEINVVPYIDVMLVLLVIFMVTAPMLALSVDVKLPSSTAKALDSKVEPVIVIARKDGSLALQLPGDKQPRNVDAAGLVAMLAPIREQQGNELRVLLAGDADAPYQKIIDATEALKQAKVTNVVLWTKQ
jgi:biopolymer transport protein TolR